MRKPVSSFVELAPRGGNARYQPAPLAERLPALIGLQADAPSVFGGLKVAVLGTGSVGGRIAGNLARLQVRELWLADPKPYSSTSSATHDCLPRLQGTAKCVHVGRQCKAIHPPTRVRVFPGPVQALPLDALAGVDVAVMAPDNLAAEMAIGQRFMNLGKPLIHAAVHGESLTAQIRVYANRDGHGPCPACGFGRLEWDQLAREIQYSCEGYKLGAAPRTAAVQSTRSFAHLCSTASDLALNQLVRLELNLGNPVGDSLLEYCGYSNAMAVSPLARNAGCLCHHCRYALVRVPAPWTGLTLEKLAREAGCAGEPDGLTYTVDRRSWVERAACGCATPRRVGRFVDPAARHRPACRRCKRPIQPQPLHTYPEVPSAILGQAAAAPLEALGAANARWVRIRGNSQSALVLACDNGKEST